MKYEERVDPWDYATTAEEQERYGIALDLVDNRGARGSAFEIGCGEALFTRMLSSRCHWVLAVDAIDTAVQRARVNCSGLPNVRVEPWDAREDPPPGKFDLVLCMDVMEHLRSNPWVQRRAMRSVCAAIASGGWLLITACRTHPVVEHARWARLLGTGANGILARFLATDPRLTVRQVTSTERHLVALCQASTMSATDWA
jgi:SAM-dependent methyltransferase